MIFRPRQFGIDLLHLADRFKKLQRKLHPDLFALKSQVHCICVIIIISLLN